MQSVAQKANHRTISRKRITHDIHIYIYMYIYIYIYASKYKPRIPDPFVLYLGQAGDFKARLDNYIDHENVTASPGMSFSSRM